MGRVDSERDLVIREGPSWWHRCVIPNEELVVWGEVSRTERGDARLGGPWLVEQRSLAACNAAAMGAGHVCLSWRLVDFGT